MSFRFTPTLVSLEDRITPSTVTHVEAPYVTEHIDTTSAIIQHEIQEVVTTTTGVADDHEKKVEHPATESEVHKPTTDQGDTSHNTSDGVHTDDHTPTHDDTGHEEGKGDGQMDTHDDAKGGHAEEHHDPNHSAGELLIEMKKHKEHEEHELHLQHEREHAAHAHGHEDHAHAHADHGEHEHPHAHEHHEHHEHHHEEHGEHEEHDEEHGEHGEESEGDHGKSASEDPTHTHSVMEEQEAYEPTEEANDAAFAEAESFVHDETSEAPTDLTPDADEVWANVDTGTFHIHVTIDKLLAGGLVATGMVHIPEIDVPNNDEHRRRLN